jgi:hypothetical protein
MHIDQKAVVDRLMAQLKELDEAEANLEKRLRPIIEGITEIQVKATGIREILGVPAPQTLKEKWKAAAKTAGVKPTRVIVSETVLAERVDYIQTCIRQRGGKAAMGDIYKWVVRNMGEAGTGNYKAFSQFMRIRQGKLWEQADVRGWWQLVKKEEKNGRVEESES